MSTKTNILHQCPTQHSPSISRHYVHTLIHTYIHTCCLYISHILFRMLCCIMFYSSLFNQQYFKQQIYSAHRYTVPVHFSNYLIFPCSFVSFAHIQIMQWFIFIHTFHWYIHIDSYIVSKSQLLLFSAFLFSVSCHLDRACYQNDCLVFYHLKFVGVYLSLWEWRTSLGH